MKVLLLESIHPAAAELLQTRGVEVETRAGALSQAELSESLAGIDMLGIRSNTQVTEKVLEDAGHLVAIGCFCIGTNQVDLTAATQRGIAVFNAPYSNTRSVAELVIGEIIALARRHPEKTQRMHDGVWDKSARGSHEVRSRTLGIVGYGNIGTQLSNLAESIGMRVVFFHTADRPAHGNARRMRSLEELLPVADVVSLHVDGRPGNAGFFGAEQFAEMKPRALFINASRGIVVDDVSLRDHLLSGHLAGAAIDVFPVEPNSGRPLRVHPTRTRQRDTHPARGRLHPRGTGGDRLVRGRQARRLRARGQHGIVGQPPRRGHTAPDQGHRLGFLHHNIPGVLANVNTLLAGERDNITAQHLTTRGELGYVVTDAASALSAAALERLRNSEHCLWVRNW